MKKTILNHKGCKVEVKNLSKRVEDKDVEKFAMDYVRSFLHDEILPGYHYIPRAVQAKRDINVVVKDQVNEIELYINGHLHISMQALDFHNMQMHCEAETSWHTDFFAAWHQERLTGVEIISGKLK